MTRYLFSGLLLLIAIATLYNLGSDTNLAQQLNRGTRASRNAVSAVPASAQELTPLNQAGQNVTRQTSPEGIELSQEGVSAQAQTTDTASSAANQSAQAPAPAAAQPVSQPANPEAIPALW